MSQLLKKT